MRPLFETTVGDYRASLNLLLAAVVCVLLIACANVANLQFARALARYRELAMRAALGASRWVIARQLLIESTLLAVIGAIAGVFLTLWSMDAILALTPPRLPRFHEAKIDMHVLAFTTFAALLAGVLVGVWPAWRISNSESHFTRAARSRRPQRQRWPRPTTDALRSGDHAGRARNCSARRRRIDIEKFLARRECAARF